MHIKILSTDLLHQIILAEFRNLALSKYYGGTTKNHPHTFKQKRDSGEKDQADICSWDHIFTCLSVSDCTSSQISYS